MPDIARAEITGAVLAGGEGRRMEGCDKGLVELAGRPLVQWVLDGLRPQVASLLISANRSRAAYEAFGVPVVADAGPGYRGPLAGLQAVLAAARTPLVLSAPCDAPRVPSDLAARLGGALAQADAEIAVATDRGRSHPLHALLRTELAADLAAALDAGVRRVEDWQQSRRRVTVAFDDQPDAFVNVNTLAERDALARELDKEAPR